MASVWYVGGSDRKVISKADWATLGEVHETSTWDKFNGFSLPHTDFTTSQLNKLTAQGLQINSPDGPRPGAVTVKNTSPATVADLDATKKALTDMVPLRTLWKPYSHLVHPDVISDTYQTDPGPIFPNGYHSARWDDPRFNRQGQNWLPRNAAYPEQGCWNNPTPRGFIGAVLDTEFDWEGDTLCFMVEVYAGSDTSVYMSDEMGVMHRVRSKPFTWPNQNNTYAFRVIKLDKRRLRRVRFTGIGTFYQLMFNPGDVFKKSPDKDLSLIISDSYREASGMKNSSPGGVASAESYHTGAISDWIQERNGWAQARLGQGGTGAWNNATGQASDLPGPDGASTFFNDRNIDKVKAFGKNKIRLIEINGTINDGNITPSPAAHKARYLEGINKIYNWDPGIRFVIWGPEPFNNPAPGSPNDLNRIALKEVAAEHPAVIGFIDPAEPGNMFWTGTGSEAQPQIESQQARFLGQDGIHYNYEGGLHYAGLGLAQMGEFLIERVRPIS